MTRTQVQLPDELYQRAKQFSEQREISLAEVVRNGLELLLDRYPSVGNVKPWRLPVVDGGLKAPLEKLRENAHTEEEERGLGRL
jgi:hypothetical protein